MKKAISFLLFTFFILYGQQQCYSQKNEKGKVKKLKLLPVYLTYEGLPADSSLERILVEAFSRLNVKLIDKKEFDRTSEEEATRIITKLRLQNVRNKSESELMEIVSREQRFVSNMLDIKFYTQNTGDTLNVIGAVWEATPFPPNLYGSMRTSGKIETNLTDVCCSTRDNIVAIIDKILYSKWLQ